MCSTYASSSCVVSSTWFFSLQREINYFFLFRTHYTMPSSNSRLLSSENRMLNSNNSIPCYSEKMPSSNRKMLNFDIKMKKVVVGMPYCFMNTNSFNKNVINFVMNEISFNKNVINFVMNKSSFNEKVVAHCLLNQ